MSLLFSKLHFLFVPTDSNIGSGGNVTASNTGTLSKDDISDFLKDDVDDKGEILDLEDPKKDTKVKDKDTTDKNVTDDDTDEDETDKADKDNEEEDDLKSLEDELEEVDDEKLELVTPVRRAEILKKYPQLFKDFPYLEKAYYREQQYTELLPTIDDAKLAVEKSEVLDNFEKDLVAGNLTNILQATKNENPRAFLKIADNYLSALSSVDEKAYLHVIGNTVRHTITAMVRESRASKNESLEIAAQLINQFVFGSSEFQNPSNLVQDDKSGNDPNNKDNEIAKERQQFLQERFEISRDELNTKVGNALTATIDQHIDPKDSMTSYVKKNAAREALEALTQAVKQDSRFNILLDKLWDNAASNKFNKESTDRIRSAYLSRARTLLPSVIKKARNEALRGMGKRVVDDSNDDNNDINNSNNSIKSGSKGPLPRRTTSSNSSSGKTTIKSAKDIPAGMRSIDFLMQD